MSTNNTKTGQITYPEKRYLGDGVYAEFSNGRLRVTTEDGIRATNTVYLDPMVYAELMRYANEVWPVLLRTFLERVDR